MTPENEQGVIVLFAQQAERAGFTITSIQTNFPDATLQHGGVTYRAEFEFNAANFKSHKHDVRKCDLVICWENDWPDCILPVLALSEPDWWQADLTLPSEGEREAAYWKQRALSAEAELKQQKSKRPIRNNSRYRDLPETSMKILQVYMLNPKMKQADVAREVGVSRRTVGDHLSKLEAAGLVKRNGHGLEVM